jgi:hypothetical protein
MNGLDLGVEGGWKEEHGIRPILRRAVPVWIPLV